MRLIDESIGAKTMRTYSSSTRQFSRWLSDPTRCDQEAYRHIWIDESTLNYEPVDRYDVSSYPKLFAIALEQYVQFVCHDAMVIQTHLKNIETKRNYGAGVPEFLSQKDIKELAENVPCEGTIGNLSSAIKKGFRDAKSYNGTCPDIVESLFQRLIENYKRVFTTLQNNHIISKESETLFKTAVREGSEELSGLSRALITGCGGGDLNLTNVESFANDMINFIHTYHSMLSSKRQVVNIAWIGCGDCAEIFQVLETFQTFKINNDIDFTIKIYMHVR